MALLVQPAGAQEAGISSFDRSVFFFGGRFHTDYFEGGFVPWELTWEDNFMVAGGYQHTMYDWQNLRMGFEVGLAGRFGTPTSSLEGWGGAFIRYDGLVIADTVRISPSFTFGLSVASASIGIEKTRADQQGITTELMVYLGPEISLSHADHPEWEVFWRLQHRSGGYGWIASFDGSNAVTGGIRYSF